MSHGDEPINPRECTIGIFSHTRPNAKGFLRQIKQEFEGNKVLQELFPDILYQYPHREAVKWSEDEGIIVRRKSNPKEATVEAWGLVDGQPTGKHFTLCIYDDIVTRESVTSPEMIAKTTTALELSYNLGAEGGHKRFIGTRYHYNDSYKTIIDRGTAIPRVYPATEDGTPDGEPVLLTRERLVEKRRDLGPYVYACFAAKTPVLMSDWSEKNIEDIQVGDGVVGYKFGGGKRATLARSKVVAVNNRPADVVKITFESGRFVICTPDHKFWSGRPERGYTKLGFDKNALKAACSIYDPIKCDVTTTDQLARGYICGIFDGEGSVSGNTFHFSQCSKINPEICSKIEDSFNKLGLQWSMTKARETQNDYYLINGREEKIKFARLMNGFGKAKRVCDSIFNNGTRNIGKGTRDKIVKIEDMGQVQVFNIQTETGNYVANGYAVKNCQMLQNPQADETQGFLEQWIKYYDQVNLKGLNIYIMFDPANGKKKGNDYTCGWVVGLGSDGNIRILDIVRDRLNLSERTELVFRWHRKYKPMRQDGVRYEQYGMQADIQHIQTKQVEENYLFDITPVAGRTSKNDRIKRMIPYFEQGKILFPRHLNYTDYQGKTRDLVQDFIQEEYKPFPVGIHDDMMDSLARLFEPELPLLFPKEVVTDPMIPPSFMYMQTSDAGWMC